MYSRYIPPPKSATAKATEVPNAVEAPSSQFPVKPQPTAYARYIPPPKTSHPTPAPPPAASHVRFEDALDEHTEPPPKKAKLSQLDSPQKSKKTSKSKKEGKKKSAHSDDVVNGHVDASADTMVLDSNPHHDTDAFHGDPAEEQAISVEMGGSHPTPEKVEKDKKVKKEKKKKRKHATDDGITHSDDDTPTRHKSVLERKARSIQPAPKPDFAAAEPETQDVVMIDSDAVLQTALNGNTGTEEVELHGLEPLPQPVPVAPNTSKPTYETLPSWLAEPIRISPQSTTPWTEFEQPSDLGIGPKVVERLSANGYKEAFAIQTGVLPLLLPHHGKTMLADVLVSAATGSGKTLSYTLPIIRELSCGYHDQAKLRAVIVLPTRELVRQVHQVFEQCCGIFALDNSKRRPRIAVAMGSQSLEKEQSMLVESRERYNPEAYAERKARLESRKGFTIDDKEDQGFDTDDEERARIRKMEDQIGTLPDHITTYVSKVDVLICTPGRLVEHIKYTPGFSLGFVRWLVVDEADKLLGQSYQQWLDIVIPRLQSEGSRGCQNHKKSNLTGVRKVILSATMTRDLDQLERLKLRNPKLVVLEGSETNEEADTNGAQAELALPSLLEESALKVSDPNLKPLFLLDLLRAEHMLGEPGNDGASDSDETSSSGSDSESYLDSDEEAPSKPTKFLPPTRRHLPTVLVFTKSNVTALRLSRLLALLAPAFKPLIGTLTSETPFRTRRDTIRSFLAGKLRILVASDLVARGLDLPSLDHVINYDMPSSVASYVHRVGRTARAGKTGQAWTLFTNPEARWFWNSVASQDVIKRSGKVERIRVTEEKEDAFNDKVAKYEVALAKLEQEAREARMK